MPSRRNSGFETTATSGRCSTRSTTRVEPTGTVDLLTTTAPGAQDRPDLAGGGLDVRQIGAAVIVLRRWHAQEHDVGIGRRSGGTDDEPQATAGDGVGDDLVEPVLDDRDLPRLEPRHLVGVDVATDDVEPEMGEAGSGREPHVARSDHRNRWSAARAGRCSYADSLAADIAGTLPTRARRDAASVPLVTCTPCQDDPMIGVAANAVALIDRPHTPSLTIAAVATLGGWLFHVWSQYSTRPAPATAPDGAPDQKPAADRRPPARDARRGRAAHERLSCAGQRDHGDRARSRRPRMGAVGRRRRRARRRHPRPGSDRRFAAAVRAAGAQPPHVAGLQRRQFGGHAGDVAAPTRQSLAHQFRQRRRHPRAVARFERPPLRTCVDRTRRGGRRRRRDRADVLDHPRHRRGGRRLVEVTGDRARRPGSCHRAGAGHLPPGDRARPEAHCVR